MKAFFNKKTEQKVPEVAPVFVNRKQLGSFSCKIDIQNRNGCKDSSIEHLDGKQKDFRLVKLSQNGQAPRL